MNSDESLPAQPASRVASHRVSLSPYVNEPLPNWVELLSAHHVARLTRRPRWVVLSLALLGRFPRKHRYHGRNIGWLRADVLTWLSRDLRVLGCHTLPGVNARSRHARQGLLPLEFAGRLYTAQRRVGSCIAFRNRSRRRNVRRSRVR
jgi:predicted DNA-binding transcriptional regulator AlpA